MLVASRRKAHRGFSRTIVRGGGLRWTRGTGHPDPDDQYNCSQDRFIPRRGWLRNGQPGHRGKSDRHGGADVIEGIGAAVATGSDAAGFHHVVTAGRGEGEANMLFDQQD